MAFTEVWPEFDLQLFFGGGGGQQINNSDSYYKQLAGNSNQLLQQFNELYLPVLQQLMPELQDTVSGKSTPLTQAAQAPVNASTSRSLNTMQGALGGGAINPQAAYSDIALSGNQNAGLAGLQTIAEALSALQNLTSLGYGSVNTAQQGLSNAAAGEGNLGVQLNANNPLNMLLGAAGSYFGMKGAAGGGGQPSGGGAIPINNAPNGAPFGANVAAPSSFPGMNMSGMPSTPFGTYGYFMDSKPISSGSSSWLTPPKSSGST